MLVISNYLLMISHLSDIFSSPGWIIRTARKQSGNEPVLLLFSQRKGNRKFWEQDSFITERFENCALAFLLLRNLYFKKKLLSRGKKNKEIIKIQTIFVCFCMNGA